MQMKIEDNSSWKTVNFNSVPHELVNAISVIGVGDNLAITCADSTAQLGLNLPHGDGALTKVVSIAFEALLNPPNVNWDEIERVEINIGYGVERGPGKGTQAHLHLLASGLTASETFPFGIAESNPGATLNLEIPRDALNRERFPKISIFLVVFAQRNDSAQGVQIGVETIDVKLWKNS
jgi:hypothetical protein